MDRTRRDDYQSLSDDAEDGHRSSEDEALLGEMEEVPFSWFEYTIFCFLGVAMLWAWNMFLAAAPYFASRFAGDEWIAANFQSTILAVSTITNLATVLVLSNKQSSASYPFRINLALVINTVIFAFLTVSTSAFLGASPAQYLVFLLVMVGATSYAAGLLQNGGYAFAAGFGRPEYMQAIMAGQAVAGVLPAVAQVVTVVMYPPSSETDASAYSSTGSTSAFIYFMAAVFISVVTLGSLLPLFKRHKAILEGRLGEHLAESMASLQEAERSARKVVSLWYLLKKLRWLAGGIALVFTATMFFPVLTTKILSVKPDSGILFQPFAFIPLGFVVWNLGDLSGRILTMLPFSLTHRPALLFFLAVLRFGELPLYFLCNIHGRGAVISSDFFYLVIVQFVFGLSNGWLGASIMMASGEWVEEGEREASGGFMGMCLVAGLTIGSLLSFTAAKV
ncbi:Nucleoside transporter FUN26-like protein [Cladobotryum mycophilum]|uniref:Nucleoside transporter FUN26-like protein n=1 Tax=Cladobotryum mycophilum TaxID=491253 RepID=A0ABR0SDW2_9HYPO